jgi:hypothetical protein
LPVQALSTHGVPALPCPASRRGFFFSMIGLGQNVFVHAWEAPNADRGNAEEISVKSIGWGTWIRTKINGVRVRCFALISF